MTTTANNHPAKNKTSKTSVSRSQISSEYRPTRFNLNLEKVGAKVRVLSAYQSVGINQHREVLKRVSVREMVKQLANSQLVVN